MFLAFSRRNGRVRFACVENLVLPQHFVSQGGQTATAASKLGLQIRPIVAALPVLLLHMVDAKLALVLVHEQFAPVAALLY